MKLLHSLTIAAVLAASAGIASATTITLNSFGTAGNSSGYSYTAPTVTATTNTATLQGGAATYNIPNGGVWAGPIGASSWVSQNSGNYPGGGNVEAPGTYTYTTTFTTSSAVTGGTLEVLADDTTSISLNGTLLVPAAAGVAGTNCTVGTPNCEVIYTINFATDDESGTTTSDLTAFKTGVNTLTFGVNQDFGSAEGLDFSGSVTTATVTPEPNTLILLGTGALGLAGVLRKKFGA